MGIREMALMIPLLPLIGFTINIFFGKQLPKSVGSWISTLALIASFGLVVSLWGPIGAEPLGLHLTIGEWFSSSWAHISFSFHIDQLTLIMLSIITGVGSLIHLYSQGYMHDDENQNTFFAYLNLFVFFMLLLVLGSNMLVTFIGWEGVGLCSYLLIGFWYKDHENNDAARKAFIINRIGDLGFLIAIFTCLIQFNTLEYSKINELAGGGMITTGLATMITLCLFFGATGKSAQIPLYTWLPDAMAGPTPVSALIHAATMVTAGIYLVVRLSSLFVLAPISLNLIFAVGVATALIAAIIGLRQNDIKKVLAYSTVSQLGFMFAAVGAGAFSSAIFHLGTHAFFKALLFLGAGSVIHAMSGEQDIRKMGGLTKALPITHFTFLIGTLTIIGFPPFAAFFSKDEILAMAYSKSVWMFFFLALTSVLTAIYMLRLYFLTFSNSFRGTDHQASHLHESPWTITVPLVLLALASMFSGVLGLPEVISDYHWLNSFLAPAIKVQQEGHVSHFFEYCLMGVSVVALIIIFILVRKWCSGEKALQVNNGFWAKAIDNKFYIDEAYDSLITQNFARISKWTNGVLESKLVDGLVNQVSLTTLLSGQTIRRIQSGSTGVYILSMVLGIITLLVFQYLSR